MSGVRSGPLSSGGTSGGESRPPARAPRIGLVRGASIERAFLGMLYIACFILALLSLFGTFYGLQGRDGPLAEPWHMAVDAVAAPVWMAWALVLQGVLTLTQWGARQLARRDARWWLLYVAVLALSVYYNVVAYLDPAVALGVPPVLAFFLIAAGDALPELAVVKHD